MKQGKLITLYFGSSDCVGIKCQHCGETVDPAEYNGDTEECNECHDAGSAMDDCRCERCFDKAVSAADFMGDD
jgi:hypothetical protein